MFADKLNVRKRHETAGKELSFEACLNVLSDGADGTVVGRLFHAGLRRR